MKQAGSVLVHDNYKMGDLTPWSDGALSAEEAAALGFDESFGSKLAAEVDAAIPYDEIWSVIEVPNVLAQRTRVDDGLVDYARMVEVPFGIQKQGQCFGASEVTQISVTSGPHHYCEDALANYQTRTMQSHAAETAESFTMVQPSSTIATIVNLTKKSDQSDHELLISDTEHEEATLNSDSDPMELAVEILSEAVSSTSIDDDSDEDSQELIAYRSNSPNNVDEVTARYELQPLWTSCRNSRKDMVYELLAQDPNTVIIPDGTRHGAMDRISAGTGPCDILQPIGIRHPGGSRWAEQLLNLCAAAIASKNIGRTQHLMYVLNELASFTGDANQRLAAYGLKALFCRITGGKEAVATYVRPFHHQEETLGPEAVHRAMVTFHEFSPWHQISYTVTNETLLEVFAGESRLHIVDVGIIKGLQWPLLIDALANRPGGPPKELRITTITHQNKEARSLRNKQVDADSAEFMSRLVTFAKVLGLHLELNMYVGTLETITKDDLKLKDGEVLAVCCQYRLHRLSTLVPSASCSSPTPELAPREAFLEFLSTLQPTLLVVSENDVDQSSENFLTRFKEVVSFWWRFFDSTEVAFKGRDPNAQQIVEYEASMIMLNGIACEGATRIELNERQSSWIKRIRLAGFVPRDMSDETKKSIQGVLQNTECEHFGFTYTDRNVVNLAWKNERVNFTSLWMAPSCCKNMCKCGMLHK